MREIKFRGKHLNKWLYGSLHVNESGQPAIATPSAFHFRCVDPDTVGQFTGLLDSNDKEIYEGDILLYRLPENMIALNSSDKSVVFYGHGMFLVSHGKIEFSVNQVLGVHGDGAVVIGNIHDNPSLLEEAAHDQGV